MNEDKYENPEKLKLFRKKSSGNKSTKILYADK